MPNLNPAFQSCEGYNRKSKRSEIEVKKRGKVNAKKCPNRVKREVQGKVKKRI
jgi:hypothetical protein